jgi:hypothetical protein
MPLGTIARLVQKESTIAPVTVGCLNSLYKSVADLDQSCFSTDTIKQRLLQPINIAVDYCDTLKLNIDDTQPTNYFTCVYSHELITSTNKDKYKCHCGNSFSTKIIPKRFHQGFVNGIATFILTDDLNVMPNCLDYASFGLLQEIGIRNTSSVKEIVLNVTKQKVFISISFAK